MILLDKFIPRPYQLPFYEAMENSGGKYRHAIVIEPRKCGKDLGIGLQYAVRTCLRKTTRVLYFLKSYTQAKEVIWDAITNEGTRYLDTIPPEVIKRMNASELKIEFHNGSILKFGSAENYEKSIVGGNASLIIFSEYATYKNDNCYRFASPIVTSNGGQFLFISTPRGRNFFFDLYQKAQQWDDWYVLKQSVEETKHISLEDIDRERREHSEEFIQQEYYCSFDRGIEGSVYSNYILKLIEEGRIGNVPYDPAFPVHTAWDLGHDDQTVIICFQQVKNNNVNVINCYANNNQPIGHYIKWIKQQEYVWGNHYAPHDIDVHDYSTGLTRLEYARQLGLNFQTREVNNKLVSATPRKSIIDGIEAVRVAFNRISIDQKKCATLIKALENYHREWDDEKKKYSDTMVHNWASDYADSFRYMCLAIDLNTVGMTEEDARRDYNKAMGINAGMMPYPFNDNDYNRFRMGR